MAHEIRRVLLCCGAGVLYYSGFLALWLLVRRWARGREEVCVIGLHRVLSDEHRSRANSLAGIVMRERTFAKLLEYLERHFTVVSLDTFLDGGREAASKPWCLLTFDDGWRDNYTTALPLLKKYNLPATVFAITGLIGTKRTFWVERLIRIWRDKEGRTRLQASLEKALGMNAGSNGLEEIVEKLKHMASAEREQILETLTGASPSSDASGDEFLSWEEAAAMQQEGIEIEAHSVTHPLLIYEGDSTLKRELRDGKEILEQKLGKKIRAFAYPNGNWDDRVRNMVQQAGYECAFAGERGWHRRGNDPFTIHRILLHEHNVTGPGGRFSPAILSLRLSGWI
jgi:peptidoglycan/xylan/chitin deacetylase (PgdA/CDA1 family)